MNLREHLPRRKRSDAVAADIARVTAIWRDCRARSGGRGPFLFGAFSIADAMYAPVATRFRTYGVELDPTCQAYADADPGPALVPGMAGGGATRSPGSSRATAIPAAAASSA